jgi:HEPN domain-containing protein
MTTEDLAKSYLIKAQKRLKVLDLLLKEEDYSDVVREAQETVELCTKGMLRYVGVEPPKFHDVGFLLIEHKRRFKNVTARQLQKAARISKRLRKEREFSFYGDIDFIPTEEYKKKDALKAIEDARWVVNLASSIII